jgi:hypothetical protein
VTGLHLAAALAVSIGIAHSYLGERYILVRLFRRELPPLFGSDWFTRRTLRFAWHLTTVAWWGFGALLWMLADTDAVARDAGLWVVAAVFGVNALITVAASRGRHLAWIVFAAIALLAGVAVR